MISDTQLWTALITPMNSDGSIHWQDFEYLLNRQQSAGNGILVLGSTGEGLALDDDEKKAVVDFLHDFNPRVPWMAGVGGFQIEKQIEWIKYCNSKNCAAFLLVAPLYAKPGAQGQAEWFSRLMDVSEKPCMLYNIPSRTGAKITPAVVNKISGNKHFWAIKEAGGSVDEYNALREQCAKNVHLFSGDDGLLPEFSEIGCAGLVSVASNVWPEETSLYVERCLRQETRDMLPIWKQAAKALFAGPNPVPVKILLEKKKMIATNTVRLPLSIADLSDERILMEADKEISNWFTENKKA